MLIYFFTYSIVLFYNTVKSIGHDGFRYLCDCPGKEKDSPSRKFALAFDYIFCQINPN